MKKITNFECKTGFYNFFGEKKNENDQNRGSF